MAAAWPHLASDGRYLRFAARLALETVAADSWQARAVAEPDAATALGALLALAAGGGVTANDALFAALDRFPLATSSCAKTPPTSNQVTVQDRTRRDSQRPRNPGRSTSSLNSGTGWGRLAAINRLPPPLAFWCLLFSGWVNRQQ